jgi:sulfhydrogenase subunit beta (sulfur reductase)
MYKKLHKKNISNFFKRLEELGKIYGPVKTDNSSFEYLEITSFDEISLSHTRTMISPKKFLLQPKETLYEFNEKKENYKLKTENQPPTIIFGVHHCDIYAINLLDKIYLDENPDMLYDIRRKNTFFIGIDCRPDKYCFCKSTGTSFSTGGFDLFLHTIKDGYFVRVGSQKGYQIIEENPNLFEEIQDSDIQQFKINEAKRHEEFSLEVNTFGLQDMLDLSYDNEVWKDKAEDCFGCGTCNLTCPTCRCYDVVDEVGLNLISGKRIRKWDSCMLKKHGLVAGELNFRPTRIERLQNRFNCKGSFKESMLNCVGCGRCTFYCPAKIDFVEVIKKVRGELK